MCWYYIKLYLIECTLWQHKSRINNTHLHKITVFHLEKSENTHFTCEVYKSIADTNVSSMGYVLATFKLRCHFLI